MTGLALQLVVRPKEIDDINGDFGPVEKVCKEWNDWAKTHPYDQVDSGI